MPWNLALAPAPASAAPPKPAKPLLASAAELARDAAERKKHGGYTLRELAEIMEQPGLWGRLHGWIDDEETKAAIPWVPSLLQRRMIQHYCHCRDKQIPCRMVVLKIRRGYGSTGSAGLMYIHLLTHSARGCVIGTDHQVSGNMLTMLKHFAAHDTFPGWTRPTKVIDDRIEWPNKSTAQPYTAMTSEASRSAGIHCYHATEVARWQDSSIISIKDTLKSLRGSVPRHGFTLGIEESTAQGSTGPFADTFARGRWPEYAVWPATWREETPDGAMEFGESLQFVRIFAAWFEDRRAMMPVTIEQEQRIGATLNKIERDLIERYRRPGPRGDRLGSEVDATIWEQLAWRRMVVAGEFDGDEEAFDQENPSSPAVAFASSGRHTFHRAGVALMASAAPQERRWCILTRQPDGSIGPRDVQPQDCTLEVYQEPRAGYRYIVGCDTMTGVEQVKNSGISDWNAAVVVRAPFLDDNGVKQPMMVVAALRPKNNDNADVLCDQLHALSRWYGNCTVVLEVNGSGYGVLSLAKKVGMNLWRRQDFDKVTQETKEHLGWKTDDKCRPGLISQLQIAIRANALEGRSGDGLLCPHKTTCAESAAMAMGSDGVDRAPHDDFVMALGMAVYCISHATYMPERRRGRHLPAAMKAWRQSG